MTSSDVRNEKKTHFCFPFHFIFVSNMVNETKLFRHRLMPVWNLPFLVSRQTNWHFISSGFIDMFIFFSLFFRFEILMKIKWLHFMIQVFYSMFLSSINEFVMWWRLHHSRQITIRFQKFYEKKKRLNNYILLKGIR